MTDANAVFIPWCRGEPENDLYGFVHKHERDAHAIGANGPFTRVMRNLRTHPISREEQLTIDYFKGQLHD